LSGEVIGNDAKEIKNQASENFRKIQPENEMQQKEVDDFWNMQFKNESEVAQNENAETGNESENLDDNGKAYREGDHLIPNNRYEINGYEYETDDQGRVVSAEGKLRMRDQDYERNMEDVKKIEGQEYRENDDKSHLIAHQFGGSDKLENLVPMDANLNRGDFAKMENTLADAVKEGADVQLKVEPVYEKASMRPAEFKVSYSIDGEKDIVVFKNESGAAA